MDFSALVARPGFSVIDAERFSLVCYVGLGNVRVGGVYRDVCVGARRNCCRHILHEFLATVGIDVVVTEVVCHHHSCKVAAFGKPSRNGKHDAVAERYHGRFHVLVGVVPFGDGVCAFEERRLEIVVHELERDGDVRDSELFAVQLGEGNFLVVVAAVVEGDGERNIFCPLVKKCGAVHSAG